MQDEITKTLKRALIELENPMPPIEGGEDAWRRIYEYARRVGYATSSIKQCLQLLGEGPNSV